RKVEELSRPVKPATPRPARGIGPPVARFLGGFITASVLWGIALVYVLDRPIDVGSVSPPEDAGVVEADAEPSQGRRGRRRRPRRAAQRRGGVAEVGDDLG